MIRPDTSYWFETEKVMPRPHQTVLIRTPVFQALGWLDTAGVWRFEDNKPVQLPVLRWSPFSD